MKVISKEEILERITVLYSLIPKEIRHKYSEYTKEINNYINSPTPLEVATVTSHNATKAHEKRDLSVSVEEAIEEMNMLIAELENYVPTLELENLKLFYETIRLALSDKDRKIIIWKDSFNKTANLYESVQSQLDKVREYANKWKDSKYVHPDANVLATEILGILGSDNNE